MLFLNWALGNYNNKNAYWYIVEEMVQNGQLNENNWKTDYFSATKEQKKMTELKNELKWLKEVDSTALQNAIQDLGGAFSSFYDKSKGKPKYKSKRNEIQSYTTKCNYNKSGATIRIENEHFIRLPKLGLIKFSKSKEVKGRILSATVRRTPSGKYFVSVLTEQEVQPTQTSFFEVGVDVGIKEFATLSDGTKIANPKCSAIQKKNIFICHRKGVITDESDMVISFIEPETKEIQNGMIAVIILLATLLLSTAFIVMSDSGNMFSQVHNKVNGSHQI